MADWDYSGDFDLFDGSDNSTSSEEIVPLDVDEFSQAMESDAIEELTLEDQDEEDVVQEDIENQELEGTEEQIIKKKQEDIKAENNVEEELQEAAELEDLEEEAKLQELQVDETLKKGSESDKAG